MEEVIFYSVIYYQMAKAKKTIIYVKGTPMPERGTVRSRGIDLFTSEERTIG